MKPHQLVILKGKLPGKLAVEISVQEDQRRRGLSVAGDGSSSSLYSKF
jgi:hypothetical protein